MTLKQSTDDLRQSPFGINPDWYSSRQRQQESQSDIEQSENPGEQHREKMPPQSRSYFAARFAVVLGPASTAADVVDGTWAVSTHQRTVRDRFFVVAPTARARRGLQTSQLRLVRQHIVSQRRGIGVFVLAGKHVFPIA